MLKRLWSGNIVGAQLRYGNELLFPRGPDHHGQNVFYVNETVEKFCAAQMGKKDEIVVKGSLIFNWQAKRLPYSFCDDFDR